MMWSGSFCLGQTIWLIKRLISGKESLTNWASCDVGPLFYRITVKNACANIDKVICRYQPVYWRTW